MKDTMNYFYLVFMSITLNCLAADPILIVRRALEENDVATYLNYSLQLTEQELAKLVPLLAKAGNGPTSPAAGRVSPVHVDELGSNPLGPNVGFGEIVFGNDFAVDFDF